MDDEEPLRRKAVCSSVLSAKGEPVGVVVWRERHPVGVWATSAPSIFSQTFIAAVECVLVNGISV